MIRLNGLAPGLVGDVLSLVNRALPAASPPGAATESVRGMEIEPRFARSRLWRLLTALGRRDAARLNQYPGTRQPIDDVALAGQPAAQHHVDHVVAAPPFPTAGADDAQSPAGP